MSTNLHDVASDMIGELIHDMKTLDLDQHRDAVNARAPEEADNCVIYTHQAQEIISRYEREAAVDDRDIDACAGTFRPSEWEKAMVAYAYGVARAVIESEASEIIEQAEARAEALVAALDMDLDTSDLAVTLDCPHGWAAHDREEDAEGASIHFWVSGQLDGCDALAIDAGPFWLSYTWTPSATQSEED